MSQSTILAHVSQRLEVSYCDLSLSGERQLVHKTFALNGNWSKLKICRSSSYNVLFRNCTNGSAPPNKRAARALDMKSSKHHLLNHWSLFKIISQMFLRLPSAKIEQMAFSAEEKGLKELELRNNLRQDLLHH